MLTHSQTQVKAAPKASFAPVRSGLLQRCTATTECDDCRNKRLGLQRSSTNQAEPASVPPIVHEVLRSPGQPLDTATRAFMEPRFGHDFSNVRVHADAKAVESARMVNALAYTVGRDVVFAAGQYAPRTSEGQILLAHELVHVVQQSGIVATQSTRTAADGPYEREANHVAQQVMNGRLGTVNSTVSPMVQRTSADDDGTLTGILGGGGLGLLLGGAIGLGIGALFGGPLVGMAIGAGLGLGAGIVGGIAATGAPLPRICQWARRLGATRRGSIPESGRGPQDALSKEIHVESDVLTVREQRTGRELFSTSVVTGSPETPTPVGQWTVDNWIRDYATPTYQGCSDTPWSESTLGFNVFGPYQLPIRGKPGYYIHGTLGPGWSPTTFGNRLLGGRSHGCIRMANADIRELHDSILPNPRNTRLSVR